MEVDNAGKERQNKMRDISDNAGKERQNKISDISKLRVGTQPQNCTALDPRRIPPSLLGYLMMLLQLQGVRQDDNEKEAVWAHFNLLSQLLFGETKSNH
jgi:hypothetical protein